jgi:acyl carrier protein
MKPVTRILFTTLIALSLVVGAFSAENRDSVTQRVRRELAIILKKDAAQLAVDKPVRDFGADDLDIVEWVMACEEAFRVPIPDEKIVDGKKKEPRKDLSIAYMTGVVLESMENVKNKKAGKRSL